MDATAKAFNDSVMGDHDEPTEGKDDHKAALKDAMETFIKAIQGRDAQGAADAFEQASAICEAAGADDDSTGDMPSSGKDDDDEEGASPFAKTDHAALLLVPHGKG